jgi:hypothetical protein
VIAIVLCLATMVLGLGLGGVLLYVGTRGGDRPDDCRLLTLDFSTVLGGVIVSAHNPDHMPVLVGLSVRRATVRLWLEGGSFARVPRRRLQSHLLATKQTVLAIVPARGQTTVLVPVPDGRRRRRELVAVVGQRDRLRVVHRRLAGARAGLAGQGESADLVALG